MNSHPWYQFDAENGVYEKSEFSNKHGYIVNAHLQHKQRKK